MLIAGRIRAVLARPAVPVDPLRWVLPDGDGEAHAELRRRVGRVWLRRLVVVAMRGAPTLASPELRETVETTLATLSSLDEDRLLDAVSTPELTSWTWLVSRADPEAFGTLAEHLEGLVASVLVAEPPPPTLAGTPVRVVQGHGWYRAHFPRDPRQRVDPVDLDLDPSALRSFVGHLSDGAELVRVYWPEAHAELVRHVSVVLPLRRAGLDPHNASVHAFRGLIATSPRPTCLAAQTLVHEAGHNKMSSILDVHDLWTGEGDAHLWFLTIHPFDDGNGRLARALGDRALAQDEGTSQRFYSLSAEIRRRRAEYYAVLEATQSGDGDVTAWLGWFVGCVAGAVDAAGETTALTLARARFWRQHGDGLTERQRRVLARVLEGFEGHLTAKKWATLGRCSVPTAQRDLSDLVERGVLVRNPGGSKRTSYRLA